MCCSPFLQFCAAVLAHAGLLAVFDLVSNTGALAAHGADGNYMERTVSHEVPVSPKCGKVFITRALAEGRMAEVEEQLEDK